MSFRLISTRLLPISIYSFQMLKAMTIQNFKQNIASFQIVCGNTSYLPSRSYSKQAEPEEMIVEYDQVEKAVSNKNILIVDVRQPEEIIEHGNIPNSINIPLGNVSTALNSMSDMEFEQTYGRKKPTEDTDIIFYCMIGKRSGMAQQNAISLGYKNVKNYVGSWTDWASRRQ